MKIQERYVTMGLYLVIALGVAAQPIIYGDEIKLYYTAKSLFLCKTWYVLINGAAVAVKSFMSPGWKSLLGLNGPDAPPVVPPPPPPPALQEPPKVP